MDRKVAAPVDGVNQAGFDDCAVVPLSVMRRWAADGDIQNAVLIYILSRAPKCNAGYKRMGSDLRISSEAARKAVARLVKKGALKDHGRRGRRPVLTVAWAEVAS